MRLLVGVLVVGLCALPAMADVHTYGWEDGTGTILGSYGALVDPENVTGAQGGHSGAPYPHVPPYDFTVPGAHSGERYLKVVEQPHVSTPQAFLAWITGLEDGDTVSGSFWGYDIVPGGSPSQRIWGSYTTLGGTIDDYAGSADGSAEYTDADGAWDQVPDAPYTWTFDSSLGTRDGLVIQSRLYSTPSTDETLHTDFFIDDLYVDVQSIDGDYWIHTPGYSIHVPEPCSLALLGLGALVVLRRRN